MRYVRERLRDRDDLSADEMWRQHLGKYPVEAVRSVFSLLESEGVPAGLLRPSDDVEDVLQPPPTGNPFSWLRRRAAFEDVVSTIDSELGAVVPRSEQAATFGSTFEDLVRVWARFGSTRSGTGSR
jgi:hypothetical protein